MVYRIEVVSFLMGHLLFGIVVGFGLLVMHVERQMVVARTMEENRLLIFFQYDRLSSAKIRINLENANFSIELLK